MKRILLLLAFFWSLANLTAQETSKQCDKNSSCHMQQVHHFLQNFSATATFGSGYYDSQFSQMGRFSLGEVSLQYKASERFSFGIGFLGSLMCDDNYYDAEGNIVENEDDDYDDDDDDEYEDDDDDECEDEFGENLMGLFSYKMSDRLPLFLQLGGGYSFNTETPIYSIMLGYNQKIFYNFGLLVGIRYSDAIDTGNMKDFVAPVGGLKAELGLSWNF